MPKGKDSPTTACTSEVSHGHLKQIDSGGIPPIRLGERHHFWSIAYRSISTQGHGLMKLMPLPAVGSGSILKLRLRLYRNYMRVFSVPQPTTKPIEQGGVS